MYYMYGRSTHWKKLLRLVVKRIYITDLVDLKGLRAIKFCFEQFRCKDVLVLVFFKHLTLFGWSLLTHYFYWFVSSNTSL